MRSNWLTAFAIPCFLLMAQASFGQNTNLLDALYSKQKQKIPVSDSVSLVADVYMPIPKKDIKVPVNAGPLNIDSLTIFPAGQQYLIYDSVNGKAAKNPRELPFLLQRTPYKRSGQEGLGALAFLGYGVMIQNNRGRYESEGVYYPFVSNTWKTQAYHPAFNHTLDKRSKNNPQNSNYHSDGRTTIDYLIHDFKRPVDTNQDGMNDATVNFTNGSIGMIGGSAAGNSQFQAAASIPSKPADSPGLKSLLPIVATGEYHQSTAFHNGVYRRALVESWIKSTFLDGLVTDASKVAADQSLFNTNNTIKDYPPQQPTKAADKAVSYLTAQPFPTGKPTYYPNSPIRSEMDISRAMVNQQGQADTNGNFSRYNWMDVPTYHLTGWWDIFINGQINTWQNMAKYNNLDKNLLVIGPWTHQRIGQQAVGDVQFPDNVDQVIGDINLKGQNFKETVQGELLPWLRSTLNRNAFKNIGKPTFVIRATPGFKEADQVEYRAPSADYKINYHDMLAFLNGEKGLSDFPIAIKGPLGNVTNQKIDIPAFQVPGFQGLENLSTSKNPFSQTSDVRLYMAGPDESSSKGNYWISADTFPPQLAGLSHQKLYWQGDQKLGARKPDIPVSATYRHDPTKPVETIGGNNLVLRKDGDLNQGPKNLKPYQQSTMPADQSLVWQTKPIDDSLAILGTPEMQMRVSTAYADSTFQESLTNTHFFVRVLDVYPDGREILVTEGAVNTHARDFAEKLAQQPEKDHQPPFTIDTTSFSNIETGTTYQLTFNLLPIGYTLGPDHRLKVVITSSNDPKYHVAPGLPLDPDSFFRWSPLSPGSLEHPSGYSKPHVLEQTVYSNKSQPTRLELPVWGKPLVKRPQPSGFNSQSEVALKVYPNPVRDQLHGKLPSNEGYQLYLKSATGQVLRHARVTGSFRLSMEGLNSGFYFLQVRKNGKILGTEKVVKQ